ncbi:MAG: CYTH domain-containing protein [Jatrophihabitans sp.]
MAETQREIETKFDVAPDFDLGDPAKLADPAEPGATVQTSTVELVSTYYDTPDQALLRSYLTLRRRVGDDDTGWQLKVPGAGFRTELRWPLAAGPDEAEELPDELRELLGPWLGSAQVRALATVRVTRTRYRLLEGGRRVLEVADDEVRASSTAGDSGSKRWRELEVEFGPAGSAAQANRVAALLTNRDALPSRSA